MDDADERLWGTPGAEMMYLDVGTAYESEIEMWVDEDRDKVWKLEEWSVQPQGSTVPSPGAILEWMEESACDELVEGGYEQIADITKDPEVRSLAEALCQAFVKRVTFRMADKLLATHVVTFDADGEPLLDGEPMYVKRAPDA